MLRRILLLCGILSSLLYVGLNILVPMQWPEYNSCSQTVSELSAVDAPTRALWVPWGFVYAFLLIAFGWGITKSAYQNRTLRIVGILIVIDGVVSLGWPFAPMHQREVLAAGGGNMSDTMHLTFAMITVIIMLLALGFGAASFGKSFRWYSIFSLFTLFAFGMLTSMDAPNVDKNLPTPLIGVWERINIGIFLIWVIVLALMLMRREKSPHPTINIQ